MCYKLPAYENMSSSSTDKSADERLLRAAPRSGVGLWNSDLDVGVQRGVGVRSFAWRCQPEGIAAYVGWIDRPKTMPFLRSAAEPLASLEEKNVEVPSWFHSVFQIFAQPKQGGIVPTD